METSDRCCLLLHGFTGGPFEVLPLAEHLHLRGYDCHTPVLPGHDPDLTALSNVTWNDWLDAASEEAKRLTLQYETIHLIGFSMGGLIAAFLANRFPIRRLVLLNAAVIYASPGRFVQDTVRRIKAKDWNDWSMATKTPLSATLQFMKLADYIIRKELPQVTAKTLIVQSERDQIVHPRSAKYIYNKLKGEKELIYFPESLHRICLGQEAGTLFDAVESFLDRD